MTSIKQVQANRRNAKLWGVKTTQGKAIVRKNAIKHGILSNFTLDPDEETLLKALELKLTQEYQPAGTIEMFLVQRIAFYMLRLRRCSKMESEYLLYTPPTEPERYIISEEELCE
jgi:hypothetical protein